jgi:hypothetical protein
MESVDQLLAQRAELLRRMRRISNLLRGSVVVSTTRCGKARCRCSRGKEFEHRVVYVSVVIGGRRRNVAIAPERLSEVRGWSDQYQRLKKIIDQLTEINLEILRAERDGGKKKTRSGTHHP